jgi:acyl carrier protein
MSIQGSSSCATLRSRQQVLEDVRQIVAESAGIAPEEITESHPLLRDLPWDSLDAVECSMELEEQFGVSIPDELMAEAKTVGDIAGGILMLLSQPPAND